MLCALMVLMLGAFFVAACAGVGAIPPTTQKRVLPTPGPATSNPVPTPTPMPPPKFVPTPTPTLPPAIVVTQVDLGVQPPSLVGFHCGSIVTFTYIVVFRLLPSGMSDDNDGGTIKFMYTTNNGRSSYEASVDYSPGKDHVEYVFAKTGILDESHTFPGVAQVIVSSPNPIKSLQVVPYGECS